MMKHYSLQVFAPVEVSLPEDGILLEQGFNVLSVFTKDLPALLARLETARVRIKEVNLFEAPPPAPASSLLLPGEDPAVLTGYVGKLRS